MSLARMSLTTCLVNILMQQIRLMMIVLKKVCISVMTLLLLIPGCIVFFKKVMILSDPKHWDHILPFMQPGDFPHRIALTDEDIRAMHVSDGHENDDVPMDVVTTRSQATSKLSTSGELSAPSTTSNSGEKV
jgi:hypothetical protein